MEIVDVRVQHGTEHFRKYVQTNKGYTVNERRQQLCCVSAGVSTKTRKRETKESRDTSSENSLDNGSFIVSRLQCSYAKCERNGAYLIKLMKT